MSPCLLRLCWIHLRSTVCGRALFTMACKRCSLQQNKELGWLELFASLGKRKVKAQMLKMPLQKHFLYSAENDVLSAKRNLSPGIFLHIWSPSTERLESCCMSEERDFQRICWISDGKHQTKRALFHKYAK